MSRPRKYTPEEARERQLESMRKAGAKWRAKTDRSDYHREYEQLRSTTAKLLRASKSRAKACDLPHDISEEDIIIPDTCPICDTLMAPSSKRGGTSASPTLDKVVPELGYVKGNIAVICKLCNSTKGSGSAELHRRIADYIESFS